MNTQNEIPGSFRTPRALQAPTAQGADPVDGLLQRTDLERPIAITFPVWDEAMESDYYQLTLQGLAFGHRRQLGANPVPGEILSLEFNVHDGLKDGIHTLRYRIQRFIGGTPSISPSIPLIIDRIPPGGDTLAPLIFPVESEHGLTSTELSAMGDSLVATVPSYFDIKWGDVIRSYWAGHAGPVHTVLAEQVSDPGFNLSVDRTYLQSLEDGDVAVTYTVTDRAGNTSVISHASILKLRIKNTPTDLLPPLVPQAGDGLIDDTDARQGVRVEIPAYTHAEAGDAITLLWGSVTLPEYLLTATDLGQSVLFSMAVAYPGLVQAGDGSIDVRYEVRREGQLLATSPTRAVQVLLTLPGACKPLSVRYTVTHAGNPNTAYSPSQRVTLVSKAQLPGGEMGLAAPLFVQANAACTLEPASSPDGTTLHVMPYQNMRIGDVVQLSFIGFDAFTGGHPVNAAAISEEQVATEDALLKGCRFEIAHPHLLAIHLGHADARYRVVNRYGQAQSLKATAYVDLRAPALTC